MSRIAIASVVRGSPDALERFFASLARLSAGGAKLGWIFVNDTDDEASHGELLAFARGHEAEVLEVSRAWTPGTNAHDARRTSIRVGLLQDRLAERALMGSAESVLFVEPDLQLDGLTLPVLAAAGVDVVGEVAWSRRPEPWESETRLLPSAWEASGHALVPATFESEGSAYRAMEVEFLRRLEVPGLHRVGGISGCMLVRRRVLEAGVRFSELPNLPWSGHGHAFCVRAVACGFELWADTCVPPTVLSAPLDLAIRPMRDRLGVEICTDASAPHSSTSVTAAGVSP